MSNVDPTRKPSTAGRYLFLLILGLVVGAVATVMLLNTWESRKTTQDRLPDALMQVQQWHKDQLKMAMDQNRCSATDVLPHLQALRAMGNDLEPAFPDLRDDERFRTAAAAMRAATDKAIAAPPLSCESLAATMKSLGDSCKACHRDFRG
ncbi:cytochrome c [Thermomonas brevis]